MDGKLSLASTKVEIPIGTLVTLSKERDLKFFLKHYGAHQKVILDADFFLKMTESNFEVRKDNSKLLFPLVILFGIGIGILIFIPLYFGISMLMFALTAILLLATGIVIGYILSKKEQERWQEFFRKTDEWYNKMKNKFLDN